MVQWAAHVAFLPQPLCRLIFEQMKRGDYLQVGETPVKILDPEVRGKCERGSLLFYGVPDSDMFLDFQLTRGRGAPHAQLAHCGDTIQSDAYEMYDSVTPPLQIPLDLAYPVTLITRLEDPSHFGRSPEAS